MFRHMLQIRRHTFDWGSAFTSVPAVHKWVYHETPVKRWVVDIAEVSLRKRVELMRCDQWLVMSYWSEEVAMTCGRDRKRAVNVWFQMGFVEIGEVALNGRWWVG